MTEPGLTAEERVLRVMKRVLTNVAKATAPRPGRPRHPLSENTIRKIRQCLCLITAREQELAREHKRDTSARPHFIDEPASETVVSLEFNRTVKQPGRPNLTRLRKQLSANAVRHEESGCWNWTGQISNTGHGRIMIIEEYGGKRIVSAECASYETFLGPIPDGMMVRQICRNRLCINPQHLELFNHVS